MKDSVIVESQIIAEPQNNSLHFIIRTLAIFATFLFLLIFLSEFFVLFVYHLCVSVLFFLNIADAV